MIAEKTTAGDGGEVQRRLRELIAALDRRVPHLERVDEVEIARAAAALRKKAVQRLTEVEAERDGSIRGPGNGDDTGETRGRRQPD